MSTKEGKVNPTRRHFEDLVEDALVEAQGGMCELIEVQWQVNRHGSPYYPRKKGSPIEMSIWLVADDQHDAMIELDLFRQHFGRAIKAKGMWSPFLETEFGSKKYAQTAYHVYFPE